MNVPIVEGRGTPAHNAKLSEHFPFAVCEYTSALTIVTQFAFRAPVIHASLNYSCSRFLELNFGLSELIFPFLVLETISI